MLKPWFFESATVFVQLLILRRAPPGFSWGPAKPGFLGLSYPSRGLGWHSRWAPPGLSWGPAASGFGLRRVLPMGGAVYSNPELFAEGLAYTVCVVTSMSQWQPVWNVVCHSDE